METANVNGSVTMDTSGFDRAMGRVKDGLTGIKTAIQTVESAGQKLAGTGLGLDGAVNQLQGLGNWAATSGGVLMAAIGGIGAAFATWSISGIVADVLSLTTGLGALNGALQTTAGEKLPSLANASFNSFDFIQRFAQGVQGCQEDIWGAVESSVMFGANLATLAGLFSQGTTVTAVFTTATAVKTTATTADTAAATADTAATTASTVATTASTAATWGFNTALSANPIGAIILAIVALVAVILLLIKFWPEITAAALAAIQGLMNIWNNVVLWFKINIIQPILDFFSPLWTPTIKAAQDAIQALKNAWAAIVAWFDANIIAPIAGLFTGLHDSLKKTFTVIGTTIGNVVGGALRSAVNFIIAYVEGTINNLIRGINLAIGLINMIPGVNIKALTLLSIPRMAQGGVISRPTVAMIGEAGREAVLPLENNTGWMAEMARQLAAAMSGPQLAGAGGDILIPVYLDGNMLDQVIVSAQERRNLRSNGR